MEEEGLEPARDDAKPRVRRWSLSCLWQLFLTVVVMMFVGGYNFIIVPVLKEELVTPFLCTGCALLAVFLFGLVAVQCADPRGKTPTTDVVSSKPQSRADKVKMSKMNQGGGLKYCHSCKAYRWKSDFHCHSCQKCISGFSHHSQILRACIGAKNIKFYVMIVSSAFIFLLLNMLLGMTVAMATFINDDQHLLARSMAGYSLLLVIPEQYRRIVMLVVQLLNMILCLLCIALLCQYSALSNCCSKNKGDEESQVNGMNRRLYQNGHRSRRWRSNRVTPLPLEEIDDDLKDPRYRSPKTPKVHSYGRRHSSSSFNCSSSTSTSDSSSLSSSGSYSSYSSYSSETPSPPSSEFSSQDYTPAILSVECETVDIPTTSRPKTGRKSKQGSGGHTPQQGRPPVIRQAWLETRQKSPDMFQTTVEERRPSANEERPPSIRQAWAETDEHPPKREGPPKVRQAWVEVDEEPAQTQGPPKVREAWVEEPTDQNQNPHTSEEDRGDGPPVVREAWTNDAPSTQSRSFSIYDAFLSTDPSLDSVIHGCYNKPGINNVTDPDSQEFTFLRAWAKVRWKRPSDSEVESETYSTYCPSDDSHHSF